MASDVYSIQEQMSRLRAELDRRGPIVEQGLIQALDISWIHHDSALEGDILDADEIVAAVAGEPPVAGSTEHISGHIRKMKAALDITRREARLVDSEASLGLLKKLHCTISPDPALRGGRYRRIESCPRTYFHEVTKPSRISYQLRRLFGWLASEEALRLHPIKVAGEVLYRLVTISPFEECSGQVGRLFINHLLLTRGYLPGIIHARDRQKYYEAFVLPTSDDLIELLAASLGNSIASSHRYIEQRPAYGFGTAA